MALKRLFIDIIRPTRSFTDRRLASTFGLAMVAVVLACSISGTAGAAPKKAAETESRHAASTKDSPVVVTARSLIADNKKKTVIYKDNVVVKKDDLTMYADQVIIKLKGDGAKGASGEDVFKGGGKVDTIEARGGVKLVQKDKTATSESATYYTTGNKIIMTGKPRVCQGDNVLNGNRIIYNIKEDTFVVEDAQTVLYQLEEKAKTDETGPADTDKSQPEAGK